MILTTMPAAFMTATHRAGSLKCGDNSVKLTRGQGVVIDQSLQASLEHGGLVGSGSSGICDRRSCWLGLKCGHDGINVRCFDGSSSNECLQRFTKLGFTIC